MDRHPSVDVLATGDDFSQVKLFKYPCPVERSSYLKYIGHSSHVTNVKFTTAGYHLISTGGNDKAIFQWEFDYDSLGAEQSFNKLDIEDDDDYHIIRQGSTADDGIF